MLTWRWEERSFVSPSEDAQKGATPTQNMDNAKLVYQKSATRVWIKRSGYARRE